VTVITPPPPATSGGRPSPTRQRESWPSDPEGAFTEPPFSRRWWEDPVEAKDCAHECAHGALPHDRNITCDCWQDVRYRGPRPPARRNVHMDATTTNGQGSRAQVTHQRTQEMYAYYEEGLSLAQVGEKFGLSGRRVGQLFAREGLTVRPRGATTAPEPGPGRQVKTKAKANADDMDRKVREVAQRAKRPDHNNTVRERRVDDEPAERPKVETGVSTSDETISAAVTSLEARLAALDTERARVTKALDALREVA
jgi:hypothetical protein